MRCNIRELLYFKRFFVFQLNSNNCYAVGQSVLDTQSEIIILIRYFYSFLNNRCQITKISIIFIDWLILNAAVPKRSWLGRLYFPALINAIHPVCLTFINDTSLSEILYGKDILAHAYRRKLAHLPKNFK